MKLINCSFNVKETDMFAQTEVDFLTLPCVKYKMIYIIFASVILSVS